MMSRVAYLLLCCLLLGGLLLPGANAQESSDRLAAEESTTGVAIETAVGRITVALAESAAPITTANFLRYVDEGRYDGTVFYRVMRLDWGTPPNGLIQGGTQGDPQRNREPIQHEATSVTGLRHGAGTISMARFAPGTAAGDFSIMVSPQPGLDAQPDAEDPAARPGFAAFGHVVAGMDVVRAIFEVPLSQTKGEGFLKGQMIEDPVKIVRMHRVPLPKPSSLVPARAAPSQTPGQPAVRPSEGDGAEMTSALAHGRA